MCLRMYGRTFVNVVWALVHCNHVLHILAVVPTTYISAPLCGQSEAISSSPSLPRVARPARCPAFPARPALRTHRVVTLGSLPAASGRSAPVFSQRAAPLRRPSAPLLRRRPSVFPQRPSARCSDGRGALSGVLRVPRGRLQVPLLLGDGH